VRSAEGLQICAEKHDDESSISGIYRSTPLRCFYAVCEAFLNGALKLFYSAVAVLTLLPLPKASRRFAEIAFKRAREA
jgi:hypothetical protein